MSDKIRRYSELIKLPTFDERFEYLKLTGKVGQDTFGFDRYLNQALYQSSLWKEARRKALVRDGGYDLGIKDRPIGERIVVHHMNPISVEDLEDGDIEKLCDPEFLICVSHATHNAIHYGNKNLLNELPKERTPNDMCPWR